MLDLISDVVNYCASSFDVGKISEDDEIVIKNLRKREKMKITGNFIKNLRLRVDLL